MQNKYNFHELKNKSNKDALPVDINKQIETLAKAIDDDEGLASLVKYREKRWFGQVVLWDKMNRHIATAYFDHGICFRHEITAYRKNGSIPVAMQSVKNEMLNDSKKGV